MKFNTIDMFLWLILVLVHIDVLAIDPIVYSRCVRTNVSVDVTAEVLFGGVPQNVTRTFIGFDSHDQLPDVRNFFSNFSAPCDLVYRDSNGAETVLYDCSSTSTMSDACAALDPAVSFDGTTIAFALFKGSLYHPQIDLHGQVMDPMADDARVVRVISPTPDPNFPQNILTPNTLLSAAGAHLNFVDVATGTVTSLPYVAGIYDSGPAYISDNRLAFTSNRDGNTTTKVFRTFASMIGSRIWTIDSDGSNPDLASHHSLSQEQHPFMLKDGRLAYSSWQIFGAKPFRHDSSVPGGFDTIENLFHIYTQAPDGAGNFAFYGQHSGDHSPSSFGEDHDAAHFLTQTTDDRVWFSDYYRGNNLGLGVVVGVIPEPFGQEGVDAITAPQFSDMYVPNDVINLAAWATNEDAVSRPMPAPTYNHPNYADPMVFAGKLGHASALSNNGLMVTWGKGSCIVNNGAGFIFTALGLPVPPLVDGQGAGTAINMLTSLNIDTPGCDAGLYQVTTIPSTHPNDLAQIVDKREWHEIMARAVVPYSAIHGVQKPTVIPRADKLVSKPELEVGTPFGLLGAASITDRETFPRGGIKFQNNHQFNQQGTDNIIYNDSDLCGIRILSVLPNRNTNVFQEIANINGERVSILGEFPVRNLDASGNPIIDASGNEDTSFLVRFPANSPYLMQGIDCDGRTLNTDLTWQSLRPGEQKTCGGCHVHSKPSRIDFNQSYASTANYQIPHLGEGTVPLLAGKTGNTVNTRTEQGYGFQVELAKDIQPIFDARCVSCHGGATPDAGLALDIAGTATGSTWWCLVMDFKQTCVPPALQHDTGLGQGNLFFGRPQLTKYIRAYNSLGSLLYWKAANQRTDNKTNAEDTTDIDYTTNHPTSITPDELGLLSRWIDTGNAGGQLELLDTQKPTLHLSATINGSSVTEFHIGTADIGSGVDVSTLVVCELDANDVCLSNLAGVAQSQGVVHITLNTALSNPNTKIFASIQDLTGNITEVRRTVSWFLTQGLGDLIFKNDFE